MSDKKNMMDEYIGDTNKMPINYSYDYFKELNKKNPKFGFKNVKQGIKKQSNKK